MEIKRRGAAMKRKAKPPFDSKTFLAKANVGRSISKYRKNQIVFSQGDPADSVFYIRDGKVKVTVISEQGKEAVVAVLGSDEFCGEGCLTGQLRRVATAAAMTECEIMRLEKEAVVRVLHNEPAFSEMFISHLLARTLRVEADLVDQLFNSPSDAGGDDRHQRSRVSHFMNKFRELGFIKYNGTLEVHSSLLSVVLHDQPQINR
ncbi:MAG: cyclic nucleotide-binding domain-containing protein [Pseudolabrys sp.]